MILKKWLASLFAIVMMSISFQSAFAAESEEYDLDRFYPADVDGHWAADVLEDFIQADIIKGYQENDDIYVKPDANITRAEFVAILLRAASPSVEQSANSTTYADVKPGDWFYAVVNEAKALGVVNGMDATHFAPNQKITRAEISAILSRFFSETIDFNGTAADFKDITQHWAKEDIEKLSKAGITGGYQDGTFRPQKTATRAEAVALLNRAFHKESGQLPDDDTLIDLIKKSNQEQYEALESGSFDQLKTSIHKHNVGFARNAQLFSIDLIQSYQESGMKIEYHMVGEMKGEVLSKSNRFAAVSITGGEVEVKITQGKNVTTTTMAGDATYCLRKTQDGWKIYGVEE